MPTEDSAAAAAVTTAGLLLETSLGSLTVDLFGADCPALCGDFLNSCRAGLWTGAIATEVIPNVAVFFSLRGDPGYATQLSSFLQDGVPADAPAVTAAASFQFWSLVPRSSHSTAPVEGNAVDRQAALTQQAMQSERRQCKRRRCIGIGGGVSTNDGCSRSSGSGGPQPIFVSAGTTASSTASPCAVSGIGRLIVPSSPSATAAGLHFGITLSNRPMDYVDSTYCAIGRVAEGQAVLQRMSRAPTTAKSPSNGEAAGRESEGVLIAGMSASAWPRPARLLRIKRAIVLPTVGAEAYLGTGASDSSLSTVVATMSNSPSTAAAPLDALHGSHRRDVAATLKEAGCFVHWASAAAVQAATATLVAVAQQHRLSCGYDRPTCPSTEEAAALFLRRDARRPAVVVTAPAASDASPARTPMTRGRPALEYNVHFTGIYLSSDDDADDGEGGGHQGRRASAKEMDARRRSLAQQHQEKANDTLSLMLNLLNGVADTQGDIKPPETVLFVCKLNPATTGDGLKLCFSQFGTVLSADVVYDAKTRQSLCYGFVEFEEVEACFRAFQRMDHALIDDSRIHVDFSQSVSKLWAQRQRELRKRHRPTASSRPS